MGKEEGVYINDSNSVEKNEKAALGGMKIFLTFPRTEEKLSRVTLR